MNDGDMHGRVHEWWENHSSVDMDSSKHNKAATRRRGAPENDSSYFENILLPPTPSEVSAASRSRSSSSSRDSSKERLDSSRERGFCSEVRKIYGGKICPAPKKRSRFRLMFPWLVADTAWKRSFRQKLPTIVSLLLLGVGAFALGRMSSADTDSAPSSSSLRWPPAAPPPDLEKGDRGSNGGRDYGNDDDWSERTGSTSEGELEWQEERVKEVEKAAEEARRLLPRCGVEYAVPGGSGYGGHNAAQGCLNAGAMAWPACVQLLATEKVARRSSCTAATWKNGECWLHDRRMADWWSEQEGDIADYAPEGYGGSHQRQHAKEGKSALLHAATTGQSMLIIRLTEGIDECAP